MTTYNPRYRNSTEYRRNRAIVLSQSDICGICGHSGAMTGDHIIPFNTWMQMYGTFEGFDGVDNIQPAHGMLSNPLRYNRCEHPHCRGRLCNESKHHNLVTESPRSRRW